MQNLDCTVDIDIDCTIYDVTLWASTYHYSYHITREISCKLIREWQEAYIYAVKHNKFVKSDIVGYVFRSSSTNLRHFKVHNLKLLCTCVKIFSSLADITNFAVFVTLGYYGFFYSLRTVGLLLRPCHICYINVISYLFVPIMFCGTCLRIWLLWCIRTCMCMRVRSV
jgi:hypothetical protein